MCLSYPAQILSVDTHGTALAVVDGQTRQVTLTALGADHVAAGDWVLVSTGLAVARLQPDEAAAQLRLIADARRAYR